MPAPAAAPHSSRPTLLWPKLAVVGAVIGLLIAFPPIRVASQKAVAQTAAVADAGDFSPVAFAEKFWSDKLQPAAAAAPAVAALLAGFQRDPSAAITAYGHRVGLGSAAYYFARGSGRVTAVERSRLLLEIEGATIAIRTGPVFGNIVRDGCGLLEVNQVPGLAEFNALSAELNRLVEEKVQPALKAGAPVGAMITFAGCAEAPEALPAAGAPLLTFIPLQVEVKP